MFSYISCIHKSNSMKIRSPFNKSFTNWRNDISKQEKNIWLFFVIGSSGGIGRMIIELIAFFQ